MGASVSKSFEQPFCLDLDTIIQIERISEEHIGETNFTLFCSDDIKREYKSVENIRLFPNIPKNRIKRLIIFSRNKGSHCRIGFSRSNYKSIDIEIDGTEESVESMYRQISELMVSIKPWYAPICKLSLFISMSLIVLMALIILGVTIFFNILDLPKSESEITVADNLASMSVIVVIMSLIAGVDLIKERLFPFGVFLIGQEMKQHETLEKLRWIAVSILTTSIIGYISWIIV